MISHTKDGCVCKMQQLSKILDNMYGIEQCEVQTNKFGHHARYTCVCVVRALVQRLESL